MISGVADTITGVLDEIAVCMGSGRGALPRMSHDEIRIAMKSVDIFFMY